MANEYYANVSGPASCSSSRWLTEEVFKLIDMVQRDEAIYNPRHKYYFCRPYVENFWREVDQKLEKNPGASLAKWTNLRISFRREYTNYLEEKVPPCWSYFDRMFFLHPYLRKKHPQPKSLDSQVQDALVRISSLSDRIHCSAALGGGAASGNNIAHAHLQSQASHHQQQLDNYLEYFDDPEQNNSELEDIMEEEHQSRFQNAEHHSLNNDIKSECDDQVDDYEPESATNRHHDHDDPDDNDDGDDTEMRSFMLDALASSSSSNGINAHTLLDRRNQLLRVKHMNRLQTRSYHDELRAKRPRSQESISSTQMGSGSINSGVGVSGNSNSVAATVSGHARMLCHTSTTPTHTNVSFVRPTLAKPVEMVSTTTNSNGGNGNSHLNDVELNASSTSSQQVAATSSIHQHQHQHQRHALTHHGHHGGGGGGSHHRLEIAAISSGSNGVGSAAAGSAGAALNASTTSASANATHLELCDCKTDPDAMFLMSLLPDIQKLNGRDRGKIKIAFQNILQDYLYPD